MFVLCLTLWLILSGRITWEILGFGIAVSEAVTLAARRLTGLTWKKELAFFRRIPAAVCYAGILLREILRANLAVIRMVWRRKDTDPCLTTFSVPLKTTAARVVLSDSITLTPGTITTEQDGDSLTVHCLDRTMAEGLEKSCFVRQLQSMEKQEEKHEV